MSIAKASEPTELNPVVIEYEETVDRIRQGGTNLIESWIARVRRPKVREKFAKLRDRQSGLTAESIKEFLAVEEP